MTRAIAFLKENSTTTVGAYPAPRRAAMATKDTVTVRIPSEGRAVAWSDGVFAGDPELVADATALANAEIDIEVAPPGGFAKAGSRTRQAAMVAMLGATYGRGLVVEQDPTLWEGIIDLTEGEGVIH